MKEQVNIFFSCDDNYIPFLASTLQSITANCDKSRNYLISVLHTGISESNIERVTTAFTLDFFTVKFYDISEAVHRISEQLHTRDYYSKSTYYRLFIPELFPELNKALYLDSDIIVTGDISELYDYELKDNLVGAVPDAFVLGIKELGAYCRNRVGLDDEKKYFNAGVLLMNLAKMRKCNFGAVFTDMLASVKFTVAQDQDYLNAICKGKTLLLGGEWNEMPVTKVKNPSVKLIHYNLDFKPWHKEGVLYSEEFWHYADACPYREEIYAERRRFHLALLMQSEKQTVNLVEVATSQANDEEINRKIARTISKIMTRHKLNA